MFKKIILFYILSIFCLFSVDKFNNKLIYDYKHIPLEVKIGQMLLVGFSGYEINDEIKNYIHNYHIGGFILFNKSLSNKISNIKDPNQVKKLNNDLNNEKKLIKLFISVDQEGGYVARLNPSNGFYKTQTACELGKKSSEETYLEAKRIASTLKEYGFNLNYAPVVDINVNSDNPIIAKYERSFSSDPEIVIQHALAYIKAHKELGIITTLKHFPGHGSSTKDSHKEFVDITNTYKNYELIPFKKIIQSGYKGGIVSSHIMNKNIDATYPVSLSKVFLNDILRKEMGFNGVIFSDDLKMKAIEDQWSLEETIIKVINSGTDVLVYSNNLGDYNNDFVPKAIEIIKKNIKNGNISEERINESYLRIINLKKEMLY